MASRLRPDQRRDMVEIVLADMVQLIHGSAPKEFDRYLRERRLLVQSARLGTHSMDDPDYFPTLEASLRFVEKAIDRSAPPPAPVGPKPS